MRKIISTYQDNFIFQSHSLDTQPEKMLTFHTHNLCEIIFFKSGDASAVIGEKIYKMTKDSLVIFRSTVPHYIKFEGNEPYERHNLLFDESALANGIFHELPKDLDIVNCSGNKHITRLFDKFDFYYIHFSGEDLRILVNNTVEELLYNLYLEPIADFSTGQVSVHPVISRAITYINDHYAEPVSIEDICAHVCVTKSYLHHLFMSNLRISPKKYINIKRLSKAQKLLNMGEKATSVYTECGFGDYVTFFRNFTNYFGYSPSDTSGILRDRNIIN